MAKAHAAPLLGHVRHPQSGGTRLLAHVEQQVDVLGTVFVAQSQQICLARLHHLVDEGAHAHSNLLEFRTEREINSHTPDFTLSSLNSVARGFERHRR